MENSQSDYARVRLEKLGKLEEVRSWFETSRDKFDAVSGDVYLACSFDLPSEKDLCQTTVICAEYVKDIKSPQAGFRDFVNKEFGVNVPSGIVRYIEESDDGVFKTEVVMPDFNMQNFRLGLVRHLFNVEDILTQSSIICSSACVVFHSLGDFKNIFDNDMLNRFVPIGKSVHMYQREYTIE